MASWNEKVTGTAVRGASRDHTRPENVQRINKTGRDKADDFRRVCCFAIAASICVAFDLFLPEPANLIAASALYAFFSIWFALIESLSAPLFLNPISAYLWVQSIGPGVASLYVSLASGGNPIYFGDIPVAITTVADGHAIMVAGAWAFYVGMKQFRPREASPSRTLRSPRPAVLIFSGVFGIFFVVFNEVMTRYLGSALMTCYFLPVAVFCMVALNPPRAIRSERLQLFVLCMGTIVLFIVSLGRDSKSAIMATLLPLAWWIVEGRRYLLAAVVFPVLIGAYLFVLAPLVSLVRATAPVERATHSILSQDSDELLGYMTRVVSIDPLYAAKASMDNTALRLASPVAAGVVYKMACDQGFLGGADWGYILPGLIPRAVWRDKPTIAQGYAFTATLGWAADADSATTSTGETAAGELFWNFGWPGVLAGMYLLGAAVSSLTWRPAGTDPRRGVFEMMIYVSTMLNSFVTIDGFASAAVLGCVISGIFFVIFLRLRGLWVRRNSSCAPAETALFSSITAG
jgi:hypothetical protein